MDLKRHMAIVTLPSTPTRGTPLLLCPQHPQQSIWHNTRLPIMWFFFNEIYSKHLVPALLHNTWYFIYLLRGQFMSDLPGQMAPLPVIQ